MNVSPTQAAIRTELRQRMLWLLAITVLLAIVELAVVVPSRLADWRMGAAIAITTIIVAGIVTTVGSWVLRRPLIWAIEKLENDARTAEAEHEHFMAASTRFVAGFAHEVSDPLSAITNHASELEHKVAPELLPTVNAIQLEATRLERVVGGFRKQAYPDEHRPDINDVNDACRETMSFLSDQGKLRQITVDAELDGSPLPAHTSAVELEQLFANLILNAVEAMPEGGRLSVWTRRLLRNDLVSGAMRRGGDDRASAPPRKNDERVERWLVGRGATKVVKVVVADSGHGIPAGAEEHVFEPFFTTKPPEQGCGLGLTTVRRIVHALDGIIWVQRSREGGAAFHLILPIDDEISMSVGAYGISTLVAATA